MKRLVGFKLLALIFSSATLAQHPANKQDSAMQKTLDSVTIVALLKQINIKALPNIQGAYIFGGKKTEVITMAQLPADIANKAGRQVFAKVPGIFVYDMDGPVTR